MEVKMDNGDNPQKPSLDDLLSSCKIVSAHNGYLDLKPENVKKILEATGSDFEGDLPVAILAVIGPKGSGKSLLTNFLIQYLRMEGWEQGGWMSNILKVCQKGKPMGRGFSWASVSNEMVYKPSKVFETTNGIYLWPEPFLMTKRGEVGEQKILVWLLHVHCENDEDMIDLEQFLAIACSRIMEIKWNINGNNEFRILERIRSCQRSIGDSISEEDICNSVVYVVRSETRISAGTDDEAKKALLDLVKDGGNEGIDYQPVLDKFQHVNLVWMKNCSENLHTDDGVLNMKAMKSMSIIIKKIVEKMMEESEIHQKKTGKGEGLTLGNMLEFLTATASKACSLSARKATGKKSCETINETKISPGLHSEYSDCKFTSTTSKDFNLNNGTIKSNTAFDKIISAPAENNEQVDIGKTNNTFDVKVRNETMRAAFFSDMCSQSVATAQNTSNFTPAEARLSQSPKNHADERSLQYQCTNKNIYPCLNELTSKETSTKAESYCTGHDDMAHVANGYHQDKKDFEAMDVDDNTTETTAVHDEHKYITTFNSFTLRTENAIHHKALTKTKEEEPMELGEDAKLEDATERLVVEAQKEKLEKKKAEEVKDEEQVKKKAEKVAAAEKQKLEQKEKKKVEKEAQRVETEKQKREMELELQRQEQKERSEMEESLPASVSQLKGMLPHAIEFWIENHLNLYSVNQMEIIYAHTFKGFTEERQKAMSKKMWEEFEVRLDAQCKAECMQTLKTISQPVVKFNQLMKRQFSLHGYLTETKMKQIADEEFHKETRTTGEGLDLNKLAMYKLLEIYKKHNEIIIETEKDVFEIAKTAVRVFYQEQMKRYLKDAPYSPSKLQNVHSKLSEKLQDAFKNACHLANSVDEAVALIASNLNYLLNSDFEEFRNLNENKIRKLKEETSKVIQKMKTQYNEKVEEMLQKNSDGLDVKTLGKYHTTVATEVLKLLEMEIKSKIRQEEPLEYHRKVLQGHIDNYWLTVVEVNSKNIKRKKERDEKERREKTKLETQREMHEAAARKQRASSEHSTVHPRQTIAHSRKKEDDGPGPLLPPLVFHLQSSRISMAMDIEGSAEILKNESGEEQTPAFVVLTPPPENIFLYGSEALAYFESPQRPPSDTDVEIYSWNITDFFLNNDLNWNANFFTTNGNSCTITTEFLLAFILRKLKHAAEKQKAGKCATALLAIPFWLSSSQRLKVKHAAKIAGFSEAYLINEATAAAFNFVQSDIRYQGEVLVVSENFGRVDAFVYQYSEYDKKIKMIAHSGNYENGDKKSSGITKTVTNFVTSFWHTQETAHKDEDRALKDIRHACKAALERAAGELHCGKFEPKECLSIYENLGKWKKMLSTVVSDFGKKAVGISGDTAVLFGSVALGRNPNEIADHIHDKLAYEVKRSLGLKIVIGKNDLPVKLKTQATTLSQGREKTSFYQYILESRHPVGEFIFMDRVHYSETMEPVLKITNEAIVSLECVMVSSTNSKEKRRVADEQVHWKTPNLSTEQLDELSDILESLIVPPVVKEDPALTEARADLLLKCQEMMEKIEADQYKIKSSLVKTMVSDKISIAWQFAEHTNSSLEGIQQQMMGLQALCEKYDKK